MPKVTSFPPLQVQGKFTQSPHNCRAHPPSLLQSHLGSLKHPGRDFTHLPHFPAHLPEPRSFPPVVAGAAATPRAKRHPLDVHTVVLAVGA